MSHSSHARRIDELQRGRRRARRRASQRRNARIDGLAEEVQELREDLGYVTLVLGGLMARLDQQGTVAQADVRAVMAELDELDGVADGRLDIDVLKFAGAADGNDGEGDDADADGRSD